MTDFDIAKPGPSDGGQARSCDGRRQRADRSPGALRASLAGQGAELAFTYQGGAFGRRASRWRSRSAPRSSRNATSSISPSVDNVFARIKEEWGGLDFVVHALAYSDPKELAGRYADTTRENFINSMVISCFSFTEIAKRAADLMPNGGSLITLSYGGATRWVPSYNVMGVAKAALEASVRYLAADLGPQGIRVNALSAGPMRTLSGAGVSDARVIFNFQRDNSPLQRTPTLDEVAGSALYLLSPLSGAVTGEVHFVDCGYNTVVDAVAAELERAGHRGQGAEPHRPPQRRSDVPEAVDVRSRASQTLRP